MVAVRLAGAAVGARVEGVRYGGAFMFARLSSDTSPSGMGECQVFLGITMA